MKTSFKSCPRVGGIQGKPVICMTMIVSSRAPVWGASYFNRNYVAPRTVSSRAPVWGASEVRDKIVELMGVSSRAPVWGASGRRRASSPTATSFKSCPRVGGIQRKSPYFKGFLVSSRAPVWGASFAGIAVKLLLAVSSRAPVWGASRRFRLPFAASQWFQVVPPCGGHPATTAAGRPSMRFQVVPPCGGHRRRMLSGRLHRMFQVVPPCGGHPGGAIP